MQAGLGPTKLIAIRSGSYDYAEVDLGTSIQLVGPNNAGKTTLINTLQFLYIDNRNHMAFGDHEPEATKTYYFPDHYSYLLFECQGPKGTYVLGWRGQSKSSGGDPIRFTYDGQYDVTDYLTVDDHVADPKTVNAKLAQRNYRELKDAGMHRDSILVATKGESNGLGVVHLNEVERYAHFKEVLKNLLSLRSIDQHEMKRSLLMLANIPPNKPALEANRLMTEDFERIRDRRLKLNTLKSEKERLEKYIGMSDTRFDLEARLATVYAELMEKRRKAHDHNKHVKEAILAKQDALEKEKISTVEILKDFDEKITEIAGAKGRVEEGLSRIAELGKGLDQFVENLEREALNNAKERLHALNRQLGNAEEADRQRTARNLAEVTARVASTERGIANFDKALITELRETMSDEDLHGLSRLFNVEILRLPVEKGGVELKKRKQVDALLKSLAENIKDEAYSDALLKLPLPDNSTAWKELVDVKAMKKALNDLKAEQDRLRKLMDAIENREALAKERASVQAECDAHIQLLNKWEHFRKEKIEEPRLQKRLAEAVKEKTAADRERKEIREKLDEISVKLFEQRTALNQEDDRFNRLLRLMEACVPPPDPEAKGRVLVSVPNDAEDAIELYRRHLAEHNAMSREMDQLRSKIENVLKSDIIGPTEMETVRLMREQIEGLPTFEETLRKDWDNYLHLLRANFANVLNGLNDIKSAAEKLNRRFTNVSVSNLESLKMEVIDQNELVVALKELAETDHTGLFDSSGKLDAAYQSFRNKLSERLTLNYGDLFTLRFTVSTQAGRTHSYDNLQVESHGTAITIKVLFNLLVLRSMLKEDPKTRTPLSRVPFFLDEIHSLDATNRGAVLRMSKDLGFMAITAAPEPVSEVDALYFLRPVNGRLVVRNELRIGVKYDAVPAEA
jgi:energy-coupling factor transporter ATP-binding protein EcfA2